MNHLYFAVASKCQSGSGACSPEMMGVRLIGLALIVSLIVVAIVLLVKKKNKAIALISLSLATVLALVVSYLYYDVASQKRSDAEWQKLHEKCLEDSQNGGVDCPV